MNLEIIRTQTTWNDASGSINNNYAKIADAIAQLKANSGGGGGGADIDLTAYATKVWVEAQGYITASALTPYALKTDIPSLVGYATEDYVTTKLVDYAPLTSVQGFENRIGGLEGAVPQLNERVATVEGKVSSLNETVSTGENNLLDRVNTIETDYVTSGNLESAINDIDLSAYLLKADLTKSRIQSTLGISDWALAATKPSYAWSEITSRPTALSQFTDDVVAGKYLPLSGGTIVGGFVIKAGAGSSATIRFSPNNGAINHWLGVNSAGVLWFSNNGWSQQYDILHSGNIGNYNAGSADILATSFGENINYTSGESSLKLVRYVSDWESNGFPVNYSAGLSVMTNYTGWQLLSYGGDIENPYFRSVKDDGVWKAWRQIAFLTDNVASATKLQTPRKLWGNDFDGTADINSIATISGSNTDLYWLCKGSQYELKFGIGSGNVNRGIYDGTLDHWWIRRASTADTYIEYGNVCIGKVYAGSTAKLQIDTTATTNWAGVAEFLSDSLTDTHIQIGRSLSTKNSAFLAYHHTSANSNLNYAGIGFYNTDYLFKVYADGSIEIGGVKITASNGTITVNGNVLATGAITAKAVG